MRVVQAGLQPPWSRQLQVGPRVAAAARPTHDGRPSGDCRCGNRWRRGRNQQHQTRWWQPRQRRHISVRRHQVRGRYREFRRQLDYRWHRQHGRQQDQWWHREQRRQQEFGRSAASGGNSTTGGSAAAGGASGCASGPIATFTGALATGIAFLDTDGKAVNAHGGGIIKEGDTYYMHGEYFLSTTTDNNFNGFSTYSSKDLATWKNEGIILPQQPSGELGPIAKGSGRISSSAQARVSSCFMRTRRQLITRRTRKSFMPPRRRSTASIPTRGR